MPTPSNTYRFICGYPLPFLVKITPQALLFAKGGVDQAIMTWELACRLYRARILILSRQGLHPRGQASMALVASHQLLGRK